MAGLTMRRRALLTGVCAAVTPRVSADAQGNMPTVRIGVLWDRSGIGAVTSGLDQIVAARLAVDDFGQFSRGYPIDLIDAEFQRRPDQAEGIARRWFEQEGVAVILDVPGTAAPVRVQEVARAANRTVMNTGSFNAALTGAACSSTASHWLDDTNAITTAMTVGLAAEGMTSWFLVVPDDATGVAFQIGAVAAVESMGGRVVGFARHPADAATYAAALTSARDSGADAVGLCSYGASLATQIREGRELGLFEKVRAVCAFAACIKDVHELGPLESRGLWLVTGFYWNQNERTRSFASRFNELTGRMPDKANAATYAAVEHFLRTVETYDTLDGHVLSQGLRRDPVYFFGSDGRIRVDGSVLLDVGLFRVKAPDEVTATWDYYKPLRTISAAKVFRSPVTGTCRLSP